MVKCRSSEQKSLLIKYEEVLVDLAKHDEAIKGPSEQSQRHGGDQPERENERNEESQQIQEGRPRENDNPGEESQLREKEKPGEESRPREKDEPGEKPSKANESKICPKLVSQVLTFALMTAMIVVQLVVQKRRIEDEEGSHRWLTNVVALSVVDILFSATLCFERTNRSATAARLTLLARYICCAMLHPFVPITSNPSDYLLL